VLGGPHRKASSTPVARYRPLGQPASPLAQGGVSEDSGGNLKSQSTVSLEYNCTVAHGVLLVQPDHAYISDWDKRAMVSASSPAS
jgi:hypothetical protein